SNRPHSWATRVTIASTASRSRTSGSIPTTSLDLSDRGLGGHVLPLGLESPVLAQVEVGDRTLAPNPATPFVLARPRPRASPVTITTFSSSFPMVGLRYGSLRNYVCHSRSPGGHLVLKPICEESVCAHPARQHHRSRRYCLNRAADM